MEAKTTYFDKPGGDNTDAVFALVRQRAKELGIKTVLVASTTGATAVKAVDALPGLRVVAVSLSTGSREPNVQNFKQENRKLVESKGGLVLTATLAFGGVNRALHQSGTPSPAHYTPGELIAWTLRVFSQGMKVTCEIAAMAADAGLVRTDEEVIAVAGTGTAGRGADTAIVVQPSNANRFFDLRVKELICKPRL